MRFSKAGIFYLSHAKLAACGFIFLGAAFLCGVFYTGCGKGEPSPEAQTTFSARVETDKTSGQPVVVLTREGAHPLVARIAPGAGANLFSLTYEGNELLYGPETLDEFDGSRPGTPVLYPSPCRLTKGRFTFDGETFDFGINRGDTWIHGLVRSEPWQYETPVADEHGARVLTWIDFTPGGPLYEKFGFDHTLSLLFSVDEKGIRIGYEVKNRDSRRLPYGFGVHPFFNFLGPRQQAYLCVPAGQHMELMNLVPTGQLLQVEGTSYDLRQPKSMAELTVDDLWFGMKTDQPASIEYRQAGIRLTLTASEEFTHLVVYIQPENPFACVENLTSSPDAQNLHARGFEEESHLLVVPPNGVSRGWIHYLIEPLE